MPQNNPPEQSATSSQDVVDLLKVVFVAVASPAVLFGGAVVWQRVADELFRATTLADALEKLMLFIFMWLAIPLLQGVVASFVMRFSPIRSRLAMRLAPWLLVASFVASLIAFTAYAPLFSLFKEGWRELTEFVYFISMITTYLIALGRLLID